MNPSVVVDWLLGTERGREALREALLNLPKSIELEMLERYRPAYVLVKLYRGGEVEVFGERFVYPLIEHLGRHTTMPDVEARQEDKLDKRLPDRYRHVNFPHFGGRTTYQTTLGCLP